HIYLFFLFNILLSSSILKILFIFFFLSENDILTFHVTGVQTCALPILRISFDRMRSSQGAGGAVASTIKPSNQCRWKIPDCCTKYRQYFGRAQGCSEGTRSMVS